VEGGMKRGIIILLGFFGEGFLGFGGICWREFELGSQGNDHYRGH
jgi:hypothetical protein